MKIPLSLLVLLVAPVAPLLAVGPLVRGLVERCRAASMPLVIQTHRGRVT